MRLGIDASNLRVGGGITHLTELLRASEPQEHGVTRVTIWGGKQVLDHIVAKPWLERIHEPMLDQSLAKRLYWQKVRLPKLARKACDLLFIPGGGMAGSHRPFVTMSRNMLPFDEAEMRRYRGSWIGIRLQLLRNAQINSFSRAEGIIFLTEYARSNIIQQTGKFKGHSVVIPHGISSRFKMLPRPQKPISAYSKKKPFRILYVSIVDLYKHQWQVAEAVSQLRRQSLPIAVDFVGHAYGPALRRLHDTIARVDPEGVYIKHLGAVSYDQLHAVYQRADAFVFASSCENMPNILLEAMAAGLPIACSQRSPMAEILGDAGIYFDPESSQEIAKALGLLIESPRMRAVCAQAAYERAQHYSWKRCASETISFLAEMAQTYHKMKRTELCAASMAS